MEPPTETRFFITPVSKTEFLSSQLLGIADRIREATSPIDPLALDKITSAVGRERLVIGNEIEPDFIQNLEGWEELARRGSGEGNIEYFASLEIKDGKITPAGEIREGWEKLSPIGVLPRSPDNIGTIHTHPGESFFSPVDFFSFLVRLDVVMAMVNSAGDITLMIKTRDIRLEEKGNVFFEIVKQKIAKLTRGNRIETEEEIYQKAREEIRFILDSAEALGIVVMRKEKEEEKFKVAAKRK